MRNYASSRYSAIITSQYTLSPDEASKVLGVRILEMPSGVGAYGI